MTVELREMDRAEVAARAVDVLAVERAALAVSTGAPVAAERVDIVRRHTERPAFRAVAAEVDGRLVGFGYGYEEPVGGWWDSAVRPALAAAGTDAFLDGAWCLVELHVLPEHHGTGLGRRLLTTVLAGLPNPRVVASTEVGANPARGFYRRLGFRELAPVRFGDGPHDDFLVIGRELPLAPPGVQPS